VKSRAGPWNPGSELGSRSFREEGDPFDPTIHEALTHHVSPEATDLRCTTILRPGYRVGDRPLRPARVEVTGPPQPEGTATSE
jgi:molecular chaperone GrpE